MKNIADNQGKIEQSRRIFSLHVRYLTFLSLLLILLFAAVLLLARRTQIDGDADARRDQSYTDLLRTSFSDAAAALRKAGSTGETGNPDGIGVPVGNESAVYAECVRTAGDCVERMIGGCALYGPTDSRQLAPYLEQLSRLCAALSRRADTGHISESDRALCLRLADQLDRIAGEDGRLLLPDAGRRLDLRISPYLGSEREI